MNTAEPQGTFSQPITFNKGWSGDETICGEATVTTISPDSAHTSTTIGDGYLVPGGSDNTVMGDSERSNEGTFAAFSFEASELTIINPSKLQPNASTISHINIYYTDFPMDWGTTNRNGIASPLTPFAKPTFVPTTDQDVSIFSPYLEPAYNLGPSQQSNWGTEADLNMNYGALPTEVSLGQLAYDQLLAIAECKSSSITSHHRPICEACLAESAVSFEFYAIDRSKFPQCTRENAWEPCKQCVAANRDCKAIPLMMEGHMADLRDLLSYCAKIYSDWALECVSRHDTSGCLSIMRVVRGLVTGLQTSIREHEMDVREGLDSYARKVLLLREKTLNVSSDPPHLQLCRLPRSNAAMRTWYTAVDGFYSDMKLILDCYVWHNNARQALEANCPLIPEGPPEVDNDVQEELIAQYDFTMHTGISEPFETADSFNCQPGFNELATPDALVSSTASIISSQTNNSEQECFSKNYPTKYSTVSPKRAMSDQGYAMSENDCDMMDQSEFEAAANELDEANEYCAVLEGNLPRISTPQHETPASIHST